MMRKAIGCTIEVIRRGIASHQFGCNLEKNGTFTFLFSSLCSSFHNVGIKNSSFDVVCSFREMLRMSPPLSAVEFTELLNLTVSEKQKQYSVALLIFQEMCRLDAHINEQTMNVAIHCYCLENKVDFGFALLGNLFKCGYEPGPETFNNLIRGLFLDNKVDEVAKLFKKVLILKMFKPDHAMIHIVINGLHDKDCDGYVAQLLTLLDEACYKVYDYCDAVVCLCKKGMFDVAFQLLSEVIVRGISPNVSTIEGVYHVIGGSGDSFMYKGLYHKEYLRKVASEVLVGARRKEAEKIFMERGISDVLELIMHTNITQIVKQQGNVFDDPFIFDVLINGYFLLGNIGKAKEFFGSMVEKGHKPSIFTYASLIIENCKKGNVNEAWHLFLQVPRDGLEHNTITYNAMLFGLFREGRFEDGFKLFKEMEVDGQISPNVYTYNILVYGLSKNQQMVEAFPFLCETTDDCIGLDIQSYEILIDVLCKDGRARVARDVLNMLHSACLWPLEETYDMVIDSLCQEGFEEEAKCLFMEMVEDDVAPQDKKYNARHDMNLMEKLLGD